MTYRAVVKGSSINGSVSHACSRMRWRGCVSPIARRLRHAFTGRTGKVGLSEEVKVIETGCIGTCDLGPVMVIYPEGVFYQKLTADDARR